MSILTRPLTEHELAAVENEPAPVAHETFTQIFSVDLGDLEILDEDTDTDAPQSTRIEPSVWAWIVSFGSVAGALAYAAAVAS